MVFTGNEKSDSMDFEWDIPSGFIKHSWLENPLPREVSIVRSAINGPFSMAMFDYWRVIPSTKNNCNVQRVKSKQFLDNNLDLRYARKK